MFKKGKITPLSWSWRLLPFRRCDRYLLGEIVGPFLGSFLFLVFVLLMFQVLRLAEFFIVHSIPGELVIKMASLMIITFLPFVLPISVLVSTLMGFGRLSSDSEIVAMKSSGISIQRLTIPSVMFGIFITVFSLFLNLQWVPWAELEFKETLAKVSNTKVSTAIQEGTFTTGFFDLLIFAGEVEKDSNRLNKIFIFDDDDKNPRVTVAKTGKIIPVESVTELGSAAILLLQDGSIHFTQKEGLEYRKIDFFENLIKLEILEGEGGTQVKPRMWTLPVLQEQIVVASRYEDERYNTYRTELWRRFGIAGSGLVFVVLGIGLGTQRTRSVRGGAFLVTIIVTVFYWFALLQCRQLGNKGIIEPWLAMQIPNFVLCIPAFIFYRKAIW